MFWYEKPKHILWDDRTLHSWIKSVNTAKYIFHSTVTELWAFSFGISVYVTAMRNSRSCEVCGMFGVLTPLFTPWQLWNDGSHLTMHVQTAHYAFILQCKDKDKELQQYRETNKTVRQATSTIQRQRKFIMLTSFQTNINSNISPETPSMLRAL